MHEDPPGSNRGARFSAYLKSVRLDGCYPWCAAFVYWCFEEAAVRLSVANPLFRTAVSLVHWKRTGGCKISSSFVIGNPLLIEPGAVFIISRGGGKGHTGIVTGIRDEYIQTIEGNTNAYLSAEGGGVFEVWRRIDSVNRGFILYRG